MLVALPSTVGVLNISLYLSEEICISGHSIKEIVALKNVMKARETISTSDLTIQTFSSFTNLLELPVSRYHSPLQIATVIIVLIAT